MGETQENGGSSLVDYAVVLRRIYHDSRIGPRARSFDHLLSLCLSWRERDNIVYRDPATAKRAVKGTIFQLETEFPLPPQHGFTPKYVIQAEFRRSMASQMMSKMVCSEVSCDPTSGDGGCGTSPVRSETLTMEPTAPLRDH